MVFIVVAVVRVNTRNELTLKSGRDRSDSQVGRVRMEYIAVHETLSDFEQVVRKAWENKVRLPYHTLPSLRQPLQNDHLLRGNRDLRRPVLTALIPLFAPS